MRIYWATGMSTIFQNQAMMTAFSWSPLLCYCYYYRKKVDAKTIIFIATPLITASANESRLTHTQVETEEGFTGKYCVWK